MSTEIKCVVSGSFKYKPQIDKVITQFKEAGFQVLSPVKGGQFFPEDNFFWSPGAFPLVTERRMTEVQAKVDHMKAIARANFTYVVAPGGYIGKDTARESGLALGRCSLYTCEPIDPALDPEPNWPEYAKMFEVRTPQEVIAIWRYISDKTRKLWLPDSFLIEQYQREQAKFA